MVLLPPATPELGYWLLHLWYVLTPSLISINPFQHPPPPSPGILTLQPTAYPKTKTSGLQRHQMAMFAVGMPCVALGTLAIEIHKFSHGHGHLVTWHGVWFFFSLSLLFS